MVRLGSPRQNSYGAFRAMLLLIYNTLHLKYGYQNMVFVAVIN